MTLIELADFPLFSILRNVFFLYQHRHNVNVNIQLEKQFFTRDFSDIESWSRAFPTIFFVCVCFSIFVEKTLVQNFFMVKSHIMSRLLSSSRDIKN